MNMRTVFSLIDEASQVCGSDRKLCLRTGLKPPQLSDMRAGRAPISPQTVGLLCDVLELLGEESRRLAAEAVVHNAIPARKEALRRAFFVCWGIGALVLSPDNNASASEKPHFSTVTLATVYTLCKALHRSVAPMLAYLSKLLLPRNIRTTRLRF